MRSGAARLTNRISISTSKIQRDWKGVANTALTVPVVRKSLAHTGSCRPRTEPQLREDRERVVRAAIVHEVEAIVMPRLGERAKDLRGKPPGLVVAGDNHDCADHHLILPCDSASAQSGRERRRQQHERASGKPLSQDETPGGEPEDDAPGARLRFFQWCNVVSCPTRSKDLVEHAKCLFGGPAPRIALRVFIGLGNQGLSVLHVL